MKTLIISLLLFFTVNAQNTWYVDRDNAGLSNTSQNGKTWETAWSKFDSLNYFGDGKGINWNVIQAGDTIFVSGGEDSTTYLSDNFYASHIGGTDGGSGMTSRAFHKDSAVIIMPAYHEEHNGDVYLAVLGGEPHHSNFRIFGMEGLEFRNIKFIVNVSFATDLPIEDVLVENVSLEDVKYITFINCEFANNGHGGVLSVSNSSFVTLDSCLVESYYNTTTISQDIYTMNPWGDGGHIIKNCTFINRNNYEGISGSANGAVTTTDTSLTDTRLNMVTGYHRYGQISYNGSIGDIITNDANTFYISEWTPTSPGNGHSYLVYTTGHNDFFQIGGSPSTDTFYETKFINNFMWTFNPNSGLYGTGGWNQGIYGGSNAGVEPKHKLTFINNILNIDVGVSTVGAVSFNYPDASASVTKTFYNNTFITPYGMIFSNCADTVFMKNNIFIGTDSLELPRSLFFSRDAYIDADYNRYYSPALTDSTNSFQVDYFGYSGGYYFPFYEWQSLNYDENSEVEYVDLIEISDSSISSYMTPESLRGQGTNLSSLAERYPEIMYDILGNPRPEEGGWDIGALQYQGTTPPAPTGKKPIKGSDGIPIKDSTGKVIKPK